MFIYEFVELSIALIVTLRTASDSSHFDPFDLVNKFALYTLYPF